VKPTFAAAAVMLGIAGAMPASAEPVRLAQTFAADVIPPFEAFAIVRAQAQYDGPRPYRRYDSGPPPSDPRYAPPPEYGAPQGAPAPYGEPDDDEDESEFLPDEGPEELGPEEFAPEEFAPDGEDEDESGALPPRPDFRTHAAPRIPPASASSRSAAVTPPKTPLPRPHPARESGAPASDPASGAKPDAAKPAMRVIDMKKPEPRI
jgi:hypothetical protein